MSDTSSELSLPVSDGGVRIERVVTSGTFELDGGSWEADNNVWVVGTDDEVVVIDCAHDARAILRAVGHQRKVTHLLCTHGHNDHINAVAQVAAAVRAPACIHDGDRMLWDAVYEVAPDQTLEDGQVIQIGDVELHVIHTPGHSPGACCFYAPALGVVFSGDTLFNGGPGATGRSFSDFDTIVESITDRLLSLPDDTVVLTGHGDHTVIADEAPHRQEWLDAHAASDD